MKHRAILGVTISSLFVLFLGSSIVYEVKATNDLAAATKTLHNNEGKLADAKALNVNEKLVDQTVYQRRTTEFFKRALKIATSTDNKLSQRSSNDERYGSPEAYESIQSLAGMASALTLKNLQMTFNEQSDGSVVGAGEIKIDESATADDSTGTVKHGTSAYTVLVTLDKAQGKWRVADVKLGQIKPGDNANDTIY